MSALQPAKNEEGMEDSKRETPALPDLNPES